MRTNSRYHVFLSVLLLAALIWPASLTSAAQVAPPAGPRSDPVALSGSVTPSPSVMFIENVGQFDPAVFFKVAGSSGALWLADDGLWVSVTERPESDGSTPGLLAAEAESEREPRQGVALHLTLDGADFSRAEPFDRLSTSVNYLIGSDPEQWHRDVPAWGGVRYLDAYPGYDLEVAPGDQGWTWRLAGKEVQSASLRADTPQATLRVEGAESLLLADGMMVASTAVGPVDLPLLDGTGVATVVEGLQVSAPLGSAPGEQSIVAAGASDLYYYLNLGGSESDYGYAIAVDSTGNAYIAGHTESDDFPTTPGVYDPEYNGGLYDAVVSKLDPGGVLTYQTFLGGSGTEHGAPVTRAGIAVDSAGNAYIAGRTNSSDFPTTPGAYATTLAGSYDVFVTKLNASGTDLAYSTLLGGTDYDNGYGIALDSAGNAYVTGSTDSSNFPTTAGAYDTGFNGTSGYDVFVTKLSASGSDLVYSTFLGGSSTDYGYGIALDSAGNAYITGQTYSSNFPTTPSAYDSTYNGTYDAFVTKLNPLGNGLAYSTFLGGSGTGAGVYDQGNSIAVDSAGNAYVTGQTESDDFPTTVGAYDATRDSSDAFVTKFDADGSDLIYSTFLGGTSGDSAYSIALDSAGNAYVTGSTASADFPTTPGAYDTEKTTNDGAFVTRLNADGSGLVYSTFLAGNSSRGIAAADSGRVWATGYGNGDAFAASLQCGAAAGEPTPTPTATTPSSPGEIQLVDNLSLRTEAGHWPPNVGDKVIAHIRVRNTGGQVLHVEHIGVRGLRNGTEYWDIGYWTIDLAAGAEWTLDPNNERPLEAGSYSFRISYSLNGTDWVEIGNEVNFTVGSPTPVPTATSPAVTPTATSQPGQTPTPQPQQKAWTLMYYLAADNDTDMDRGLTWEYNNLRTASANSDVNIVAFWDGIASDARYDHMTPSGTLNHVPLGEVSTGDPETLRRFVEWAQSEYPANHYALVIRDHGHGVSGAALDNDPVREDFLTAPELKEALTGVQRVEVVWMATCLQGNIESAYQLRDLTDYYIGSESTAWGPSPHAPYVTGYRDATLDIPAVSGTTTGEQLAEAMARTYAWYIESTGHASTISVFRMSLVPTVAVRASALAGQIRSNWSSLLPVLVGLAGSSSPLQRYDAEDVGDDIGPSDPFADLYHFAQLLHDRTNISGVRSAATDLMAAVTNAMVWEHPWSADDDCGRDGKPCWDHSNSHGMSIFFPSLLEVPAYYNGDWLDYARGTNWFLQPQGATALQTEEAALEWGPMLVEFIRQANPDAPVELEPPLPVPLLLMPDTVYLPQVSRR